MEGRGFVELVEVWRCDWQELSKSSHEPYPILNRLLSFGEIEIWYCI